MNIGFGKKKLDGGTLCWKFHAIGEGSFEIQSYSKLILINDCVYAHFAVEVCMGNPNRTTHKCSCEKDLQGSLWHKLLMLTSFFGRYGSNGTKDDSR